MPKTNEPPMFKHSVRLYAGELEELGDLFPAIGANKALRVILHNYLRDHREKAANIQAEGGKDAPELNLNLD